ncbi:DUF3857 domain-containing protein [bacterium]|nr:DUF3857 domain-containing protein [bacterium]
MRRLLNTLLLGLLVCLAVHTPTLNAEQLSLSGQQDIEALMKQADEWFGLENQDAIILFDGRKEYWLPDGRLRTMIHRIVYINGDNVQDHFGDNRIPWDSKHRSLEVKALRTWRLGRDIPANHWWEAGETAVVETLPYALDKAADYTNIRETMMLHDGIELPCVLELAYVLEDMNSFRDGAEGMYLFANNEPTVSSWFFYGVPKGTEANYNVTKGFAKVEKDTDDKLGLDVYSVKANNIAPMGYPHGVDPAAHTPHFTWSTWQSWRTFGEDIKRSFELHYQLSDALRDSLHTLLKNSITRMDRVQSVTEFINRTTRLIDYDNGFWIYEPRTAIRTFNSGYGHAIDRGILVASLLKEAGFMVWPCYFGAGYGAVDDEVPTLARMGDMKVWISAENLEAFYDPKTGKTALGFAPIYGKTVWLPGSEDNPVVRYSGDGESSVIETHFDVAIDCKTKQYSGSGFYQANGGFCGYHMMREGATSSKGYLQKNAKGVLSGVKITDYSPLNFDPIMVSANYNLEGDLPEKDDFDRMVFDLGSPGMGILYNLPGDIHLEDDSRTAPIQFFGKMEQNISFTVDKGKADVFHLPESFEIKNDAGMFTLTVEQNGDKISYSRSLKFNENSYDAKMWKQVRALLLAEKHEKNRRLYFHHK